MIARSRRPAALRFTPRLGPVLVAVVVALVVALASPVARAQANLPTDAVWIVPIDTEITPATAQFVRSRVARANDARPLAVLFRIDTPGGSVAAMQEIVDVILSEARVPTLAVVENAFSAGALIAMAAEQLAMLPGSSIGAALPITVTPTGVNPVEEKFSSALRGQFRSVAEARGRNARVAEGMVDERIEIPGVSTSEELVTLTAEQAVEQNIADVQARTLDDALEQFGYGGAATVTLDRNLTERLGTWLANPILAAILLVIGIGGIVIEIFTPGLGVPGAVGVVALVLLGASAFVATPAGIWDVLLILAGILLIAAEAFIIPGFGVAGVLGIAALVVAVIRIFQDDAIAVLGWTALFGGGLFVLLLVLLPRARFAAALKLPTRLIEPPAPTDPAEAKLVSSFAHLQGEQGIALSDLRPAGVARFDGARVDVVTQGDFITSGSTIRVLRVEGNRVTVEEVESPDA